MLARLRDLLIIIAKVGVALSFAVMIAAVLVQVIGRTAGSSPVWTEELTRFALLFMVAFGVGLSLRTGDLVNVDVVCDSLPAPLPKVLRFVCAVIIVGFCALLLPEAQKFFAIGAIQKSPAMGLRMDVMHATVLIFLGLLMLFGLIRIIEMLTGADRPHHLAGDDEAR
ncbi:MAG: hypothetical protein AcusKO_25210 [Acuticoccus sp.]